MRNFGRLILGGAVCALLVSSVFAQGPIVGLRFNGVAAPETGLPAQSLNPTLGYLYSSATIVRNLTVNPTTIELVNFSTFPTATSTTGMLAYITVVQIN